MDDEFIFDIYNKSLNNLDFAAGSLDKALYNMKLQGDVGNFF